MKPGAIATAIFLFTMAAQSAGREQQQPAKASIAGTVTRAGSGQAIAGARVSLLPLAPPQQLRIEDRTGVWMVQRHGGTSDGTPPIPIPAANAALASGWPAPSSPIAPVFTDANGKFVFKDLDAGSYQLWIAGNGYVGQEYNSGQSFALAAGQALDDIAVKLTPTGSISGRVHDSSGRPAVGVPISIHRRAYDRFGRITLWDPAGTARTDDHGDYRIFWITPGRYHLVAGGRPEGGDPNGVSTPYAPKFFPNERTIEAATFVEVPPGGEVDALDFAMTPEVKHHIRGRVIDPRTGLPPARANIFVSSRLPTRDRNGSNRAYYDAASGTFDAPDLVDGDYVLTANISEQLTIPPRPGALVTAVTITLAGADVENVLLVPEESEPVRGQVRADAPLPASSPMGVRLEAQGVSSPTLDATVAVNPDGSFSLDSSNFQDNAEYRAAMIDLPAGWYLKEARIGQADALNTAARFPGAGNLELVLSSKAGRIEGVAKNDNDRPAADVTAVLVPDTMRGRVELFQSVGTEDNGSFVFDNIPPGDYKIYAWEKIDSYSWFDPEVLKEFEARATPVRVSESFRHTMTVSAIPAGDSK